MTREQDELREIARHAQAQVDYMTARNPNNDDTIICGFVGVAARAIDKEAMDGPASPWNIGRQIAVDKAWAVIRALEDSGYVVVPTLPSSKMGNEGALAAHRGAIDKKYEGIGSFGSSVELATAIYAAMIAARPRVVP